MKAEFWYDRWEQNRIGFHQQEVNSHLQEFWDAMRVASGATVFVPLCGKSGDMLWLRSQGYQVLGVELSPIAVQSFFTENDLEPTVTRQGDCERWETDGLVILQGDFFALQSEDVRHCDAIFDRAALIALPPDLRVAYVKHLRTLFEAGRNTLLLTLEYDQTIASGPPFAVLESELNDYFAQGYAIELLQTMDASDDLPGLKKRGVLSIEEKVYLLTQAR